MAKYASERFRRWILTHRTLLIVIAAIVSLVAAVYFVGNWAKAQANDSKARQSLTVEAQFLISSPDHAKKTGLTEVYGTVRFASVRGVDARLFDTRTAYGFLILECNSGIAVLRADLNGPVGDTRLTRVIAHEVPPDAVPGGVLDSREKRQYLKDYERRGPSKRSEFVLHYGDE